MLILLWKQSYYKYLVDFKEVSKFYTIFVTVKLDTKHNTITIKECNIIHGITKEI
jgi:hypothetical protein